EREIREWRGLHAAAGLDSATQFARTDDASHPDPEPGRSVDRGEESAFETTNQQQKQISRHRPPSAGEPLLGMTAASQNDVLPADTVYLGGGTPSLFDPADLARHPGRAPAPFRAEPSGYGASGPGDRPLETKGATPGASRTGAG